MLAKAIRENKNINGIGVKNKEIKLSQYADDTTLILDGTRESLLTSLQLLDGFYVASGLRLHDQKNRSSLDRSKLRKRRNATHWAKS